MSESFRRDAGVGESANPVQGDQDRAAPRRLGGDRGEVEREARRAGIVVDPSDALGERRIAAGGDRGDAEKDAGIAPRLREEVGKVVFVAMG
jgi:hypothetical protein